MRCKLQPLGDRVVLQVIEEDEIRASGLVIPPNAQDLPQRGTVLAVGPGRWSTDGSYQHDPELSVGDTVLYSKYAGHEVTVDGDEYLIVDMDHILGVVESQTATV